MTLEKYFEKSSRKSIEQFLLWCEKERNGEESWLYQANSRLIKELKESEMKAVIEALFSAMTPFAFGILDVDTSLYCHK